MIRKAALYSLAFIGAVFGFGTFSLAIVSARVFRRYAIEMGWTFTCSS